MRNERCATKRRKVPWTPKSGGRARGLWLTSKLQRSLWLDIDILRHFDIDSSRANAPQDVATMSLVVTV